jgi:Ca2+-binding RTX toxin-like protein
MVQLYSRVGGEISVNAITAGNQSQPAMVQLASGRFVIVWTSSVGSGSFEIRGQLYAADGTPIGSDFAVSPSAGSRGTPQVAALSTGGFVVTWTYDVHDGNGTNAGSGFAPRIRGQIFDSAGAKVGGELTISSGTAVDHSDAQVVALANGAFVVSWTSDTISGGLQRDVVAQIFNSAGAPTSALIALPASTAGSQTATALAARAGGGFVATWADTNSAAAGDSSGQGVKAQLFDAAGAKVGGEFLVNTVTNGQQYSPSVATLASGGFVVAWIDFSGPPLDPAANEIKAQIFDAAGAKVGGEFLVHAVSQGEQLQPSVTAMADGGFVVAWRDGTSTDGDVKAQVFDSAGAKVGIEFVLGTETAGLQTAPAVLGLSGGGFAAAWTGTDDSGSGVKAQLFAAGGVPTDITLSATTLSENAFENETVGLLSSEGAVNSGFTYEIVADSTGGAFRIEGNRLVVADNAKLDFETVPQVTVTVRTIDANGASYTEALSLDVTDIEREVRYSAGDQFLANSTQAGLQGLRQVVALDGGGFALLWIELDTSGLNQDPDRTVMRLYDSAGLAVSGEITIASEWLSEMVAVPLADGGLLIAYNVTSPNGRSVAAQAYDPAGNAVGAPMVAGTTTTGFPGSPAAVQLSSGGYALGWSDSGVFHVQLFDETGDPTGAQMSVVDAPSHFGVVLVATPSGGFVAAWGEGGPTGDGPYEVKAQFFDASGAPLGGGIAIPAGEVDLDGVAIVPLAGGGYMLGWVEEQGELNGMTLQAIMTQRIGADGDLIGEPRALTVFYIEEDFGPNVTFAAHPDGGFLVTWPTADLDTLDPATGLVDYSMNGHLFDAEGNPVGASFRPTLSAGDGRSAVLADGSLVTAWNGPDSQDSGVYARVYSPANSPNDEILTGDDGANLLDGGDGNDSLYGLGGSDDLRGGSGNDKLDGGSGADVMRGGSGNDLYWVDDIGDTIEENAGEGTDEVRTGLAAYSLAGSQIENLAATTNVVHEFRGSGGDNILTGGGATDFLLLQDGGDDTAFGGDGNDVIYFGTALSAGDVADGGAGRDAIVLQGNVAVVLNDTNLVGIESISLQSGANPRYGDTANNFYDFDVTTADGNVAAGQQLIVNAQSLRAGEDFTFNGSAETDGRFLVYGGHGVDRLTGGDGVDVFFFEGQRWGPNDKVDGGAGRDSLVISAGSGTTHIEFAADALTSIESISVNNRYATDPSQKPSYELVLHNGNIVPGGTLIVNGFSLVDPAQTVSFDGSAVHDGSLFLLGGAGLDTLKGGDRADVLYGAGARDNLTGGGGADIFQYRSIADSLPWNDSDIIRDFQGGLDKIDLSLIDADINTPGDQAFTVIGSAQFSGHAGELRIVDMGQNLWLIMADVDGDARVDFTSQADFMLSITRTDATPMLGSDFIL